MTDNEQRILEAIAKLSFPLTPANLPISDWPRGYVDDLVDAIETMAEQGIDGLALSAMIAANAATSDTLETLAHRGPLPWELATLATDYYYFSGQPCSLTH